MWFGSWTYAQHEIDLEMAFDTGIDLRYGTTGKKGNFVFKRNNYISKIWFLWWFNRGFSISLILRNYFRVTGKYKSMATRQNVSISDETEVFAEIRF